MADTKWSQFPSESPDNADEIVGLHSGHNARFSFANLVLAVRQGLADLFVPVTRTVNNKALSEDITLTASDVGAYQKPSSGIPASDLASGVIPTVPSISTAIPQMDGTGAAGSTGEVADAGHVHPRDTNPFDATRIFNTVTDVHTDTTITLTENVANYKLLYIELNTRSNNSSTYRMSLIFAASRPYNAMAIANSEYTGYVKLTTVSGQPKQLRFQETSATSLYVATVYGIR